MDHTGIINHIIRSNDITVSKRKRKNWLCNADSIRRLGLYMYIGSICSIVLSSRERINSVRRAFIPLSRSSMCSLILLAALLKILWKFIFFIVSCQKTVFFAYSFRQASVIVAFAEYFIGTYPVCDLSGKIINAAFYIS